MDYNEGKIVAQYHRLNAHGGYLIHKKIAIMTEYEDTERILTSFCIQHNDILSKYIEGYIPLTFKEGTNIPTTEGIRDD